MRVRELVLAFAVALPVLSVGVPATPVSAEEGEEAAQPQTPVDTTPAAQAEPPSPAAAGGLVAYIDPETGGHSHSPTEAQRAELQAVLAALLDRSEEGLYEVVLPDGSVGVDLQGRFHHAIVVRVAPDGSLQHGCVADVDAATAPAAAVDPQPPPAAAAE